jgi:quinol monooxygenase YgiN
MLIVHVHVHVKPDCVEVFKRATIENARASVNEPGIARFDVVQQENDPSRFVLVEAYRTADAPAAHKQTAHYIKWRDTVALMSAEARGSVKYTEVFWTA